MGGEGAPSCAWIQKGPRREEWGWGRVTVLKERALLGHLLLGRLGLSCLGPAASWNTPSTLSPQPLQLRGCADLEAGSWRSCITLTALGPQATGSAQPPVFHRSRDPQCRGLGVWE